MGQKYLRTDHGFLIAIIGNDDINQLNDTTQILGLRMNLSKSFGYALRGVLFVAVRSEHKPRVQLDEIAATLGVPRHFMGKVMKKIVKSGVLSSVRGPHGGFCINESTLQTNLLKLVEISGDSIQLDNCVLRFKKCNDLNPCPLHCGVELIRKKWVDLLADKKISDLLDKDEPELINSIVSDVKSDVSCEM